MQTPDHHKDSCNKDPLQAFFREDWDAAAQKAAGPVEAAAFSEAVLQKLALRQVAAKRRERLFALACIGLSVLGVAGLVLFFVLDPLETGWFSVKSWSLPSLSLPDVSQSLARWGTVLSDGFARLFAQESQNEGSFISLPFFGYLLGMAGILLALDYSLRKRLQARKHTT